MRLAEVFSRAQCGLDAPLVRVEVHLAGGLPSLGIVGLPETAVKESKDRVRSAIVNSGFDFPRRRITVNLAPADLPKEGGRFDLPNALGILAATAQLPQDPVKDCEIRGELSLGGDLRRIVGALPAAIAAGRARRSAVVPTANGPEVALASGTMLFGAGHMLEVCRHVRGNQLLQQCQASPCEPRGLADADLAEVVGQHHARRALEIAAAGGHSLLMIGPPGAGKSMLAVRLPGILPLMSEDEALEAAAIRSVAGQRFDGRGFFRRPFRSPHHTASAVAMVGGGARPRPGEISLAHNGVLFLDEMPEFDRRVLEVLREPMETGRIHISRAAHQAEFPARFQLIAAMNPCPCGYFGDGEDRCHCSPAQVRKYRGRVSGPVLDRIDMHVEVMRVKPASLQTRRRNSPTSSTVAKQVRAARSIQFDRGGIANAALTDRETRKWCQLDSKATTTLELAMEKLGLSARAYQRILRVARTIADLVAEEQINVTHISEAIGYRRLDRRWRDE